MRPGTLAQLQQQYVNHFVHLTQRALPAADGSRVRGVEMLPSVDVPNIPSSETSKKIKKETISFEKSNQQETLSNFSEASTSTAALLNVQRHSSNDTNLPQKRHSKKQINRRQTFDNNLNLKQVKTEQQLKISPDKLLFLPESEINVNQLKKKASNLLKKSESLISIKSQKSLNEKK